jgi:hypothetical protein
MRDYNLNVNQLVTRLIPHFVRKPVHIAFLQTLTRPLTTVNVAFREFVAEKRIEANLTSQTMLFENYLNRTFMQYFDKPSERIQILHGAEDGLPVYFTYEEGVIDPVVYNLAEAFEGYETVSLTFITEGVGSLPFNFRLSLPRSLQDRRGVVGQIIEVVEKYKIGGYGYDIIYV